MTLFRLISPVLRSALMLSAGTALLLVPSLAGMSSAAVVTGVAVGILAMSLGIAGTDTEGRGTISISAHAAYDRGLALGLLVAAIAFGLAGEQAALAFFGGAGLAALFVATTTRYSIRRA